MPLVSRVLLFVGFTTLPILVSILSQIDYWYDYLVQEDNHNQVFDYIIVGAGSAGAVLANRLSKHSAVLLLEAGGNPLPFVNSIPGFTTELLHLPQLDWLHETVPQKYALYLSENQVAKWPRGKMLGGTSNINFMLYMRGHPLDFDNWANLTGDPTWSYKNVVPYFEKSLAHSDGDSDYGSLHLESLSRTPLYKYFRDGALELGYEELDLKTYRASGFSSFDVTQRKGERYSSYNAFLQKIRYRRNLSISTFSQVIKIRLNKNNRVTGVWYLQHGITKYASTRREIIVSAGAIDTPKILMVSGIGPEEHLKAVGVKTKVNLPVGQGLQDHLTVMMFNILIDKPISFLPERDFGMSTLVDYFLKGTGYLASPISAQGQVLLSTSEVKKTDIDWPNIQLYMYDMGVSEYMHSHLSKTFGYNETILLEYLSHSAGRDGVTFSSSLVRPKSRGEIRLKDKNPLTPPLINPQYLEEPQDMKALIESMEFVVNLVENTAAFKKLNARFAETAFPPCKHLMFKSDAYFECYIRHVGTTMYHPVGTCRMGKVSDTRTVVDSQLRVKGVGGLRVADASIMPEIVNANTNAPAIMIGEKASDFIRDFWSQQFLICDKFETVFNFRISDKSCFYSKLV